MQKGNIAVLIIVLVVVVAGYWFTTNYSNKRTKSEPAQIIQTNPASSESTTSADMANWKTYKNSRFSFKYPENIFVVSNPRNFPDDIPYFFRTKQIASDYTECLKLGDKPETGSNYPRDWEGACDLKRVLFSVGVVAGDMARDQSLTKIYGHLQDDKSYLKITTFKDTLGRDWVIFSEWSGGIGESSEFQADLGIDNIEYSVIIKAPDREIDKYLLENKLPPEWEFYKVILSTFKFIP